MKFLAKFLLVLNLINIIFANFTEIDKFDQFKLSLSEFGEKPDVLLSKFLVDFIGNYKHIKYATLLLCSKHSNLINLMNIMMEYNIYTTSYSIDLFKDDLEHILMQSIYSDFHQMFILDINCNSSKFLLQLVSNFGNQVNISLGVSLGKDLKFLENYIFTCRHPSTTGSTLSIIG